MSITTNHEEQITNHEESLQITRPERNPGYTLVHKIFGNIKNAAYICIADRMEAPVRG